MAPVLYLLAFILNNKKFHKIFNKINMNPEMYAHDFSSYDKT